MKPVATADEAVPKLVCERPGAPPPTHLLQHVPPRLDASHPTIQRGHTRAPKQMSSRPAFKQQSMLQIYDMSGSLSMMSLLIFCLKCGPLANFTGMLCATVTSF